VNQRTHIVIPQDLAQEIESLVGKRGRSQFLTSAAWKEVRRLRVLSALKTASGAWQKRLKPAPKKALAQPSPEPAREEAKA